MEYVAAPEQPLASWVLEAAPLVGESDSEFCDAFVNYDLGIMIVPLLFFPLLS